MSIIEALQDIGEQPKFYNIDYYRYSQDQISSWFEEHQFDMVGISAVVSTAYGYTKWLTNIIHQVSPKTTIVIGGNLAASAEILLKKCNVDFCIIGDGELIIKELIPVLHEYNRLKIKNLFKDIKGICYLESGKFIFTGFAKSINANEIVLPKYEILSQDGSISHYIYDTKSNKNTEDNDDSTIRNGKTAIVVSSKGCVSRCTFCHRFEKGYRVCSIEKVIEYIKDLQSRYGVTHIDFGDENFGSDRKHTHEFISRLGTLGVTWQAAGVRVKTVSLDELMHWYRNGCVNVYFGVESGSDKILQIMEKGATVKENINALRWVAMAGITTIPQLVIGMPGENDSTIKETIEFIKNISDFSPEWNDKFPSELISINYAQALPGTPLYEWARKLGYIGSTVEEEERYLLRISDIDAYSEDHFINYTGLPLLKVLMWRPLILAEIDAYHALNKGWYTPMSFVKILIFYTKFIWLKVKIKVIQKNNTENQISSDIPENNLSSKCIYFNIHSRFTFVPIILNSFTRKYSYSLIALAVAFKRGGSIKNSFKLLFDHILWIAKGRNCAINHPDCSLRKLTIEHLSIDKLYSDPMNLLRQGR